MVIFPSRNANIYKITTYYSTYEFSLVEYLPRVVQILSPPYDGNIVLNAGPAQFGIDLGKSGMGVSAEIVLADPFKGCTELTNKEAADHRIVVMERGDCMFIDKVS
jgi:mannosidase alpha-like ER degradation enhancer 3